MCDCKDSLRKGRAMHERSTHAAVRPGARELVRPAIVLRGVGVGARGVVLVDKGNAGGVVESGRHGVWNAEMEVENKKCFCM